MSRLLIVGCGYSAAAFMKEMVGEIEMVATVRRRESFAKVLEAGGAPLLFDGLSPSQDVKATLATATHLLISAPPSADGDPLLLQHYAHLLSATQLKWIGYLSTVGVYGDHQGAWVDEATVVKPTSARARQRVAAESAWQALANGLGSAIQIFRLGGIYGPGRNTLVALADGSQKRIIKPGQVFNRIHVADIAGLIAAGMAHPDAGPIFNGVDDEPAPPQDVVVYAAQVMGLSPPPETAFELADLSPMGRSFYAENKRVSNSKTKAALGYSFRFPTYRQGLAQLADRRDWERSSPPDA